MPALLLTKPPLAAFAVSAAGFVPPGWILERSVTGDLNSDGRPDIASVVKGDDPTLSFRWDGKRLGLVGFDRKSVKRNSDETEDVSANFLTHRARIMTGSIEDDVATRTRWQRIPSQPYSLETIGDGLAFELKRKGD